MINPQNYKGTRDFYPTEQFIQDQLFATWQKVLKLYGYQHYGAPLLEYTEIYQAKSGQEIVNEQTYSFIDKGDRPVSIRPEMTPSLARMVAKKYNELIFPLRWYSIPNLWRYERPQRGRLREHWQLNVDNFGLATVYAELELMEIIRDIFSSFKADDQTYVININHRQLLKDYLEVYLKLDQTVAFQVTKLLDKKDKLSEVDFEEALSLIVKDSKLVNQILVMTDSEELSQLPDKLKSSKAYLDLNLLFDHLAKSGINNAIYKPTVIRGFDYYTGIVFEVFDKLPINSRSIFGGGRYDGLASLFGAPAIESVGFGLGDVAMINFLEAHHLLRIPKFNLSTYLIVLDDCYEPARKLAQELRASGIQVAVDYSNKKLNYQLKKALQIKAEYVIIYGQFEVDNQLITLKELATAKQFSLTVDQLMNRLLA